MKRSPFKIKIIDNFLQKRDLNELVRIFKRKKILNNFKVYHNEINDYEIISSSINKKILKRIHKNYFLKAIKILKELSPQKVKLYDYSDFTIIITNKRSQFPIHDDTPNKLLSGVIYLYPKENTGTLFYSDKKGSNEIEIKWKKNRAVFFARKEKETWHAYKSNQNDYRIVLVYNLMTYQLNEVYKIENKNFLLGYLRFKINPFIFKYFKITV
jgi:hypothetical protein